jgi:hypothetical protein
MTTELKDTPEGRILLALVAEDFPGSAEMREQVHLAKIERVVANGAPALLFKFDQPVPKADVRFRIPVEGEGTAEGPRRIHGLLHVVDGLLDQLEFYRENGDPIDVVPSPDELQIIVNG